MEDKTRVHYGWTSKNWFKHHPLLSIILGVFIFIIIMNAFSKENSTYQPANIKIIPTSTLKSITPKREPECHPNYSGCLNPYASDYDCIGGSGNGPYYTGRVRVYGFDVFGLDRDGDGWGCE